MGSRGYGGSHLLNKGKHISSAGATSAHAVLVAALNATNSKAAVAQERVRAATDAWERERSAADALARRVTEAECYLHATTNPPPVVHYLDSGASTSHQAPPSSSRPRYSASDLMIVQLHF